MSGWASVSKYLKENCCDTQQQCYKKYDNKIILLEEQIELLTSELRDTHDKIRSKLDFLLKRVQDLERKSLD
jgi:uncharacterized coiled-coil protein SlyX